MTGMHDPVHPGEIIQEALEVERWTRTEAVIRLVVTRNTLSRVVNCKAGVSPRLALALERLSWSDAEHWVRMQGTYDLAQARKAESVT